MPLYITGGQNRVSAFESGSVLRGSTRSVCRILEPFGSLSSLSSLNGWRWLPLGYEKMKTEVGFIEAFCISVGVGSAELFHFRLGCLSSDQIHPHSHISLLTYFRLTFAIFSMGKAD